MWRRDPDLLRRLYAALELAPLVGPSPQIAGGGHGDGALQADREVPDRHVSCRFFDPL